MGHEDVSGGRNPADHGLYEHVHGQDCDNAIRELYTFLDGELTDSRRAAIRGHLDDCHPCLEAFDFEAELRLVVSHHCRATVPEALKLRIAALLAQDVRNLPSS